MDVKITIKDKDGKNNYKNQIKNDTLDYITYCEKYVYGANNEKKILKIYCEMENIYDILNKLCYFPSVLNNIIYYYSIDVITIEYVLFCHDTTSTKNIYYTGEYNINNMMTYSHYLSIHNQTIMEKYYNNTKRMLDFNFIKDFNKNHLWKKNVYSNYYISFLNHYMKEHTNEKKQYLASPYNNNYKYVKTNDFYAVLDKKNNKKICNRRITNEYNLIICARIMKMLGEITKEITQELYNEKYN